MSTTSAAVASLLVVDDEPRQLVALCHTLEDAGYAASGFTSPAEALAALRTSPFDLLLTDLMMPEMDGIELLASAHQIDPNLVGIVMTGHAAIETAVDAMKAGALDYVVKPFKLSTMRPVLARALEVRKLRLEILQLQQRVQRQVIDLEAANRELEAFSWSVSHDLRAPLRAINGFSSILEQDYARVMPAEARLLLGKVTDNAQRMGDLIEHLLAFSRISRERLQRQSVDMNQLVRSVIDEFSEEISSRQVTIKVEPLPVASCDPVLLRQVFVNLLSNALKFTRRTGQAVIEVSSRAEGRDTVYFMRDNGVGFDMQYAAGLFGVFQRLHRAEDFEGTGVGLSLVQRIVERHGGRIWADAALGSGATFSFTVPDQAER